MNTMNSYITNTSSTKKKKGGGFKERERERRESLNHKAHMHKRD